MFRPGELRSEFNSIAYEELGFRKVQKRGRHITREREREVVLQGSSQLYGER